MVSGCGASDKFVHLGSFIYIYETVFAYKGKTMIPYRKVVGNHNFMLNESQLVYKIINKTINYQY